MPRRRNERVNGPYKHRRKWRVNHVSREGHVTPHYFESKGEAEAFIELARKQIAAESYTVSKMIDEYIEHCRTKGNRGRTMSARSATTTRYRLERFFADLLDAPVSTITRRKAQRLYDELVDSGCSVDTHRNTLGQVKTLGRWAVKQGHWRRSPFAEVEGVGERSVGKEQLNPDEARTFADYCLERAVADEGAVPALLCLIVGLRASQVVGLTARTVAADGRWVQIGKRTRKTKAGEGRRVIADFLAPHLARLRGRGDEPLWDRDRHWLYRNVLRLCKAAGVPEVCPHGQRGTQSSLATEAGATALDVARTLGHSSPAVTARHYQRDDALAAAKMDRALAELGLGAKTKNGDREKTVRDLQSETEPNE